MELIYKKEDFLSAEFPSIIGEFIKANREKFSDDYNYVVNINTPILNKTEEKRASDMVDLLRKLLKEYKINSYLFYISGIPGFQEKVEIVIEEDEPRDEEKDKERLTLVFNSPNIIRTLDNIFKAVDELDKKLKDKAKETVL